MIVHDVNSTELIVEWYCLLFGFLKLLFLVLQRLDAVLDIYSHIVPVSESKINSDLNIVVCTFRESNERSYSYFSYLLQIL